MMNILFIASWWPTVEKPIGGVFIKEHAYSLSKIHNVTVVYVNDIKKSKNILSLSGYYVSKLVEEDTNINIYEISGEIFLRRFGNYERALFKFLRKKIINNSKYNFDIVHLNVLPTRLGRIILSNSKKITIPIVLTEHSSYYHTSIYFDKLNVEKRKEELKYLLLQDNLKAIMPVSQNLGSILIDEYGVDKSKIYTVPNVANKIFRYNPKINLNSNRVIISLAAIWKYPKNPLLFVKVLNKIKTNSPDIYSKLEVIWMGDGEQMKEVKEFVKLSLDDLKITFTGFLDKNEISKNINSSDVFVHPSSAENLPCIIIESLSCGCPVISADINGVVELIEPDVNGKLYLVDNLESFYKEIIDMIMHIDKYKREKIALDAKNNYSEYAVSEKITQVYRKVLS